jgi:hypothetical protein
MHQRIFQDIVTTATSPLRGACSFSRQHERALARMGRKMDAPLDDERILAAALDVAGTRPRPVTATVVRMSEAA